MDSMLYQNLVIAMAVVMMFSGIVFASAIVGLYKQAEPQEIEKLKRARPGEDHLRIVQSRQARRPILVGVGAIAIFMAWVFCFGYAMDNPPALNLPAIISVWFIFVGTPVAALLAAGIAMHRYVRIIRLNSAKAAPVPADVSA